MGEKENSIKPFEDSATVSTISFIGVENICGGTSG